MNLIGDFKAALSKITPGTWTDVAAPAPNQQAIGGFENDADAVFVVTALQAAPHFASLYEAAKAVYARSLLGFTYLRKADRDAIAEAVKRLEA